MPDSKIAKLAMRGGWWTFAEVIRERRPFIGGGGPCHGNPKTSGLNDFTTGKLYETLVASRTDGAAQYDRFYETLVLADYVVYSYLTPIAWHVPGVHEWIIPDVHYLSDPTDKYPDGDKPSKTTTRHQNLMRTALAVVAAEEQAEAKLTQV